MLVQGIAICSVPMPHQISASIIRHISAFSLRLMIPPCNVGVLEELVKLAYALDGGIGFLLPSEYHWRRAGECEPQSLVPCSAANAIRTKQQSTLLSW